MNTKSIIPTLLFTFILINPLAIAKEPRGDRSIAVVALEVAEHEVSQSLSLIGKLEASESVVIAPEAAGKVDNIFIQSNQDVKKGQLLVKLSDDKAKASVAEATAYLSDQQRILKEYQRLLKKGAITQTEIDGQKAAVEIAMARLSVVKASLNDLQIDAPFSGTVGFVDFSRGKLVSIGEPLLTLDNLKLMELDLQVPERYLAQLSVGMSVTAESQAWGNTVFQGKVVAIDPRINPNTLNLRVRVHFDNPDKQLKPGMLMAATLDFPPLNAPIIPVQALQYSGTKRFVYVIDENNQAQKTEILLGARIDNQVVVENGLAVGQKIVTQGVVNMRDGVKVREVGASQGQGKSKESTNASHKEQ
ncbi:efflux RND transporter periplasmic adaptor subunit [Vibrio sp. S9_S30]|uniref:efflux RND transporter periplasmic adaptor subunit n=1 Tax=Vibrio sp. S9_S30 TaxID=2720226 RepID=UPI001681AB1A|nr:efflux RND transporter periplasmic adaptor subunit [Vibrio sp. S9_S30]MBD1559722.1 efflux RND transporter periplasmic adaptor subunit [Vibrio sp. S9_S30]